MVTNKSLVQIVSGSILFKKCFEFKLTNRINMIGRKYHTKEGKLDSSAKINYQKKNGDVGVYSYICV